VILDELDLVERRRQWRQVIHAQVVHDRRAEDARREGEHDDDRRRQARIPAQAPDGQAQMIRQQHLTPPRDL